jgi:ABC-type phosphate transport system substrate-binding protein
VTDLKLTPALLADIFTGQITTWQDPRIQQLNPSHQLPVQLRATVRADQSFINQAMTSWFETQAKSAYEAGDPAYASNGVTTLFPVPKGSPVYAATGEPAVALALTKPETIPNNDGYAPDSQGDIGFLDTSASNVAGLPTVQIIASDGKAVGATAETLAAGYAAMTADPATGVRTPAYSSTDSAAYPLTTVTYAAVPQQTLSAKKIGYLKTFLSYATGAGQDDRLPAGYVPLPADARKQASTSIGALASVGTAKPSATPRPSSSPTTKPSHTPAPTSAAPPPAPVAVAPPTAALSVQPFTEAAPSVAAVPSGAAVPSSPAPAPVAFARDSGGGGGGLLPIVGLVVLVGLVSGPLLLRRGA